MESHDLGYERLREQIVGSSTAPSAASESLAAPALPGYDLLVQAVGGLMSITGEADGSPQKVGVALVDVLTGLYATVGILIALDRRHQTGVGQRVTVDLLSSLLASLVNQAASVTAAGVMPAEWATNIRASRHTRSFQHLTGSSRSPLETTVNSPRCARS